jgi:hypothetical protein
MLPEGWEIVTFPDGVRHDDCTWFYGQDGEPIVSIEKGNHRLAVIPGGDIDVTSDEHGFFYSSGGSGRGRLTENLIKHGNWNLNNWLNIQYEDLAKYQELAAMYPTVGPCFDDFGRTYSDVCYRVSEACNELANSAKLISQGKHPFCEDRPFPIDFATEPLGV